jgi:hypothetical protein
MSKFRIAIQEYEGSKPGAFRNVMIICDDSLDSVKDKILFLFSDSYARWKEEFNRYLLERHCKRSLLNRHGVGTDLFDHRSVGKDISATEFLKNEIGLELLECRGNKR